MITFITVKGKSIRCARKNHKLLPILLKKVKEFLDIIVITDSKEISNICEKHNINYYIEDKKLIDEFHSIYNYLRDTNRLEEITEFALLPVTHPLCNIETIMKVVYSDMSQYDVVTTFTYINDRSIFYLNEENEFIISNTERKGSLCSKVKMADGSCYKLTTHFLKQVINSNNSNYTFWNYGKIKFIENSSEYYIDIDEKMDLMIFEKYFKK